MLEKLTQRFTNWWDAKIPEEIEEKLEYLKDSCNSWGYSEWGYSLDWIKRQLSIGLWLNRKYFRLASHGMDRIPRGRCLLIGNHSGQMAYDGMIIATALFSEANPPIFVHSMVGSFFAYQPLYAILMPRLGQLSGTPENCVRLLNEERTVMVFPEGEKGGGKTIYNRYKLFKFGQGFMRIALEAKAPIVPFGFIGGEEMVPSFSRMEPLGKLIGMPYMPLSPTGILPLPTKCAVYFGEPLHFDDDPLDDDAVDRNIEQVRSRIRDLIDEGLKKRESIF